MLNSLGKKMGKRTGFNVIESAQKRALSDFLFDLDASLLTTDTLKRRTYTVPFLEKEDKYSIFNLVLVSDSVDNILDQYVLQYEFDSLQYQTFQETNDLLFAGFRIKRFPFSSFFNDSSPGFLERCQGIADENGDPVACDQVTIDAGSGGGGGAYNGGTAWITPGGSSSGGDGGSSGSGSGSAGGGGELCSWTIRYSCGGDPRRCLDMVIVTIVCGSDPYLRKSTTNAENLMTCMDCSVSDFGSPAFTLTRDATTIDNLLNGGNLLTDFHLHYLSNNPIIAAELRAALMEDSNIDQAAALFTISAGMNGTLTGNFHSNFGLAIEGFMTASVADLTQDPIIRLFQTYFEIRYAALKSINPSWSNGKLFYETAKEAIHLALDGIGLIEGFGAPADLLNAGLYYIEGDRLNGNLSLIAATPVIGLWSTTVKGALKLQGIIPGTTRRITQVWAKNGNEILFGGTRLGTAMGITDPTKHAHHILPLEHAKHPVIQKAAKAKDNPFHIHEIDNGVAVDAWQNTTHPQYNQRILSILESYKDNYPNATSEQAMAFLQGKMQQLKQLIQANPNVKLNDLIFK